MRPLLAAILVGTLVIVGCEKKSEPGGPGAAVKKEGGIKAVDKKDTFKLSVPRIVTTLKPGEKKEVALGIDRGKDFKEEVSLKFEAPKNIKVEPASADIKPEEPGRLTVKVEAAKDAPQGAKTINVIATPKNGLKASESFTVQVVQESDTSSGYKTPLR
jgi:uncharacterized membrane protein